ncbi:Bax inhibitor-1/YccA family protein [Modestobacter sp. NPDC049651]|uniref:Bax inhibitor-1/YccA family protein n=1 Tax=unclassified Modestobacter TaxID=2643866 RepID=UPI0033CE24CE
MPSSNPAFSRGFPAAGNGQYGGWGSGPQQTYGGAPSQHDQYSAPSPYAARGTAYMTMDDVVRATGLSFLVTVLSAAATWVLLPESVAWGLAVPAILVAFVLGLVMSFKQIANPAATLSYGVLYGIALGAISEAFNTIYPGIVMQALIGTFGVFAGMLVVYKTGAVRVTPKLTRWVIGAAVGALVLLLVNFLVGIFTSGDPLGLRDGGPVAIGFSLLMIGIAAFMLLLDFDSADEAIRRGAPPKFAWYIAFGLLLTVIWLYMEILRLLSYLRE